MYRLGVDDARESGHENRPSFACPILLHGFTGMPITFYGTADYLSSPVENKIPFSAVEECAVGMGICSELANALQ